MLVTICGWLVAEFRSWGQILNIGDQYSQNRHQHRRSRNDQHVKVIRSEISYVLRLGISAGFNTFHASRWWIVVVDWVILPQEWLQKNSKTHKSVPLHGIL